MCRPDVPGECHDCCERKKVRYGLSEDCIIEKKFRMILKTSGLFPSRPSSSASSGSGRRTSGRSGGSMPAGDHRGDRGKYQRGVPEHPLPGGVLEESPFKRVISLREEEGEKSEVRKPRKSLLLPFGRPVFPAGVEIMSTPMKNRDYCPYFLKPGVLKPT